MRPPFPFAIAVLFGCSLGVFSDPARADLISGEAANSPRIRLKTLFASYWEDQLQADPLEATFVGVHRFNDRLADPSRTAQEKRAAKDRETLRLLKAVDVSSLTEDERIDRDVLVFLLEDRLAGERYKEFLIPITQQEGLHLKFAQGVNFHPTATVGDVENYVRRLNAFLPAARATVALMREGAAEKRFPPRLTMEKVLPQLRALAKGKAEDHPCWGITTRFPGDLSAADRDRLTESVRKGIESSVIPGYAEWADFIEKEYMPACRESVGLWDSPEGPEHYAYLVKSFTTLDLTPDQVHGIGLREMAKTRSDMEKIREKVGFSGDLSAFFKMLRVDPRFRNTDEKEILARYQKIFEAVDAKLPMLFGRLPRTDYGLRAIEAYRAKSAAAGYYYPFPADGSRPGYFYVNTSDPDSRTIYSMQALAYHEAVPGHHLQFAIAIESQGRPEFRRNGYVPAFSEGWGLYSESLPGEVGLYIDPYAEFGRLEYNAWRCARLVVDTGMHHKKWTRDQAIRYLEENTAVPRIEIESEIDRYIAWPGQALAYKIGELKIREIRAKAEARLGSRFDIRVFHDRLLEQGSLPLSILEKRMDGDWGVLKN